MAIQNPSYLLKSRHGIWYFQIQIPKKYRKSDKRQLFRKSLKTNNRLLALKKARTWWLRMEENDFQWEEEANYLNEMYHRGKLIYQKLNALDADDIFERDLFFEDLSPRDEAALKYYNDKLLDKTPHIPNSTEPSKSSATNDTDSFKLSELTDKFIAERRFNWRAKSLEANEHKDQRPKISLFIEIIGNMSSDQLTRQHIIKYKEALFKLPSHKNKKKEYRDKTIAEILKSNVPKSDLWSKTTIDNHFGKISKFLKWMTMNGHSDISLETPLHGVIKKTKTDSQHRDVFSDDDLISLFNNDYYFRSEHKKASHYWVPLLALFTGARQNEICQLYVNDIKEVDGIWIIDFNDEEDKKLKTLNSKRQVPIHSILINKLKFLKYVESLQGKEERLFPELKKQRDGYGQAFSKWFNRTYKRKMNVGQLDNEKKDFHSFRHTLSNYFKQLGGIEEYRVAEIIGHKSKTTSITYDRYGKPSSVIQKKQLIDKLKFELIDFKRFGLWI